MNARAANATKPARKVAAKRRASIDVPPKANGPPPSASRSSLGRKVSRRMPAKAMTISPSSPSPSRARGAKAGMPAKATGYVPRASRPNTEGRKRAIVDSPAKAMLGGPAPASPSPTSGKRRKAGIQTLEKATAGVPSAASPDSELGEGGHCHRASTGQMPRASLPDLSATLSNVFLLYEQRRDLLATASGLTNRLKALTKIRRGLPVSAKVSEAMIAETPYPPIDTLLLARGVLRDHLHKLEAQLEKLAPLLPAYASLWTETRGLGALGLALIAGEAGDLAQYDTHSKLWRRFGLHVGGGKAFYIRRAGMSKADWKAAGYCPRRRSVIYQITDSLLKGQLKKVTKKASDVRRIALGPYGTVYLARKQLEREKAQAEGLKVAPAAKIPEKDAHKYRSAGHIHNRAVRYVGKKLLRDLWKVWRREAAKELPKGQPAVASRSPSAQAAGATYCVPKGQPVRAPAASLTT